jgi:hypothetical protein
MDTIHICEDSSKHPLARILDLFDVVTKALYPFKESHAAIVDTLVCLSSEAMFAYKELWPPWKRVMLSAFYARTILELFIWTKYCVKSPENADRFSNDSKRDIDGLRRMLKVFGEMIGPNLGDLEVIKSMGPEVIQYAEKIAEQTEFDTKYKQVRDAAEELGGEAFILYKNLNILFSKFAHPTAMMVRNFLEGERAEKFGASHLVIGSYLMTQILLEIGLYSKTLSAS